MFLYFIFVLLAIIAIVVTVRILHSHQQRALEERANEDLSLPPVDPDTIPDRDGLEWEEDRAPENSAPSNTASSGTSDTEPQPASAPETEPEALQNEPDTTVELQSIIEPKPAPEQQPLTVQAPQSEPEPDSEPEPEPEPEFELELQPNSASEQEADSQTPTAQSEPDDYMAEKKDWKENVQVLKNADQYDDALRACQAGWPQWQSYQQAAIVCRAAFRQPDLPEEEAESWRQALYLLATHASFLHDKVDDLENLSWQRLEKTLSVEDLRDLDSNWQEIGYKQLRLLNKTDCRLLSHAWGEPAQHQSAKRYYKNLFLSITSS